jgi:biotin transport system substrate-specific component
VALIALGAHARFFLPGNPVPVTLQTLFILLAGGILGASDGAAAALVYIALGILGAPFFARPESAGFLYLAGPTGGYLVGFVAASALVGFTIRRTRNAALVTAALLLASLLILALGTLHLARLLSLGPAEAMATGFLPFLPGDVLKTCFATVSLRLLRRT